MGDYQRSQEVDAPADQLSGYRSEVGNVPRYLEWGSDGPNDYRGSLDVSGDGRSSTVTVFLHTEPVDSGDIDRGIAEPLAAVRRLVEAGPAPGPVR